MDFTIRPCHRNMYLVSRMISGPFYRKIIKIDFRILLLLPSILIKKLAKIALSIEKAHSYQRKSYVG